MQAEEIDTYLAQLGQELQTRGIQEPVRILLIGGAFMLFQMRNRHTTDDVDVFFKDIEDTSVSPLYQQCKTAVRAIATRNKLKGNWFNDMMADALRETERVPEGMLWRTYGVLEIYLPPKEYILALKLMAGRQKDKDDILALCRELKIQTREQAQCLVDFYHPDKEIQRLSDLGDTLDEFF